MRFRLSCIILLSIIPIVLIGQSQKQSLEEKAAHYFSKQNWTKLIELGEKALADRKTFEDLHYRMGVAYFKTENYWKGIPHLEKAKGEHGDEKRYQKYLIDSYLYANRKEDALYEVQNFSDSLKKEFGLKIEKPIDLLHLEAGIRKSSIPDSVGNMTFVRIGAEHQLNYRFKIAHAFTIKRQNYLRTDFNQIQYYIRGNYTIAKGLTLMPAFHYLRFQAERAIPDGLGGYISGIYSDIGQNGFAGFIGLQRHFGRLRVLPFISALRLKTNASDIPITIENMGQVVQIVLGETSFEEEQFQVGLEGDLVLPFWNNGFQLGGMIAYHRFSGTENTLWKLRGRHKIHPKANLEIEYFKGGALYFLEDKAAFFNNAYSPIDERIGAKLEIQISEKTIGSLQYQRAKKPEQYFNFNYDVFLLGLALQL